MIKDCVKSGIIGLGLGMVLGGILVAKNKKLATKIDQCTDTASDKLMELKDQAEKKINDAKKKNNTEQSSSQAQSKTQNKN